MEEWIRNILVYVILSALLRGLISNQSYLGFYQFTSGMILLLLLAHPLLSLGKLDGQWYQKLEQNLFQADTDQIQEELSVADRKFQDILQSEYEQKIEEQIRELAREQGKEVASADISWEKGQDGALTVSGLEVCLGQERPVRAAAAIQGSPLPQIGQIQIGGETEGEEGEEKAIEEEGRKEDRQMEKAICRQFGWKRKDVTVWKIQE